MNDWLTQYRTGHEATVWREMSALDLRDADPRVIVEARLVCDEMAGRARRNVEVIVRRLTEQGYRFHTNDDERTPVTPFFPASPRAEPVLAWLEEHFGAAPLTLSSWMRVVGDVWLVGKHPLWDGASEAGPARRRDGRGALPRGAHDRLLRERLRRRGSTTPPRVTLSIRSCCRSRPTDCTRPTSVAGRLTASSCPRRLSIRPSSVRRAKGSSTT